MTTSKFDPPKVDQHGLAESLGGASLPDIDRLTKLANQFFSAPPCDGSRLSAAASAGQSSLISPLANFENVGVGKISPHDGGLPGEAEVRHFFASQKPSFEGVSNHLDVESGYGKPAASGTVNDFTSALAGFDKSALAGIFSPTHGLPSEAELQKLLVSRPPNGGSLPDNSSSSAFSAIPAAGPSHPVPQQVPASTAQSVQADISPITLDAEIQALFARTASATGELAQSANKAESSLPGISSAPNISGSSNVPSQLDTSLIAGLSPQNYGLPGEAELQQIFAAYLTPLSKPAFANNAAESNFYFLDELKNAGFNGQALGSAHPPFDVHAVRRDFPILQERVNGYPLAWFDNAATTQKPRAVIDRVSYFYEHENSNIHRAAHELAARATDAYEKARNTVARFVNAPSSEEIIFVRSTTEAINLIAQSWGRQNIGKDDEIVITWLEHHANIVPWQQLCAVTGAKLRVAPVDDSGQVLLGEYQKLLNSHTKLVSFTQVSNALGTVTPAEEMIAMAHRAGARVLLDGAQSVSHLQVDVQALDCDWLVFSGHKIFGPTGIGAVYGKAEVLEAMPPWQGGGNMIEDVTFEKTVYQPAPAKFEAGTGNIADAVGLGTALEYLTKVGIHNVARYEHELLVYGMEALKSIPGLRLIGTAKEKTSVLSFVLAGHSNQDIGIALNQAGIAVRTGHHCAQPILRRFGLESTVRPSIAFYNTYEELDRLVDVVKKLSNKHQGKLS